MIQIIILGALSVGDIRAITDEQRSRTGWIVASKYEVIFERALSSLLAAGHHFNIFMLLHSRLARYIGSGMTDINPDFLYGFFTNKTVRDYQY